MTVYTQKRSQIADLSISDISAFQEYSNRIVVTKESAYRKKSERSKYKLEDKISHSHAILVLKFWD